MQVKRLGVKQVWDLGNKKAPLLHTLDEHLGYVTCIEWIPGEILVLCNLMFLGWLDDGDLLLATLFLG